MARPSSPRAPGFYPLTSRHAALELLRGVTEKRLTLEQAITKITAWKDLAPGERAFAQSLASGTLRKLGYYDAVIARAIGRDPMKVESALRAALRLGAHQLLHREVPDHAAVAETLKLFPGDINKGRRGLLNAGLRRIAEGSAQEGLDPLKLTSPDWLFKTWRKSYGLETAQAIASAHLQEAPIYLTLNGPAPGADSGTLIPPDSFRLTRRVALHELEGYEEGHWWVQDLAAKLVARLGKPKAGLNVIDLCAAPGGKALYLAKQGAQVTALDLSAPRLGRLEHNLARTGLTCRVICADATTWTPDQPADLVLLDAPCSATGTIRRHPDIAILRKRADIRALVEIQDALLDAAAAMVKNGGHLVYAVCSLQPFEGEQRVTAFLKRHPAFALDPIALDEISEIPEALTPEGYFRSFPFHRADIGGVDGFFAARLQRT